MNRASILPLFLFAASGFAQNGVSADGSKNASLTHLRIVGADCPISMEASHATGLPTSMSASPQSQHGPSINGRAIVPEIPPPVLYQRIHLTMTNLAPHEIVSAQITAHGYSNQWKTQELANASQGPDLKKMLDVVLDVKGNGHASSDLSLNNFTAVSSIDVESITYADGSTWRASSPAACSVVPDMVMRLNAMK